MSLCDLVVEEARDSPTEEFSFRRRRRARLGSGALDNSYTGLQSRNLYAGESNSELSLFYEAFERWLVRLRDLEALSLRAERASRP